MYLLYHVPVFCQFSAHTHFFTKMSWFWQIWIAVSPFLGSHQPGFAVRRQRKLHTQEMAFSYQLQLEYEWTKVILVVSTMRHTQEYDCSTAHRENETICPFPQTDALISC